MTHTYHGLSRAFPYVELEPIIFAVESSNELIYRITCFRGLSHGDAGDGDADDVNADADAGAVVVLSKVSSQTSRYDMTNFNGMSLGADRCLYRRSKAHNL